MSTTTYPSVLSSPDLDVSASFRDLDPEALEELFYSHSAREIARQIRNAYPGVSLAPLTEAVKAFAHAHI